MDSLRITHQRDLDIAFTIRKTVFVDEQKVSLEDEFDDFDNLNGLCEHILVYSNNLAVGTGRIRVVDGIGKLERICILMPYRKQGFGNVIVQALEAIANEKGISQVKLHAQTYAEIFYSKLGYLTSSDVFMEDGIPHILMKKDLN